MFVAQDLLTAVKKSRGSLAAIADDVVASEERELVELARNILGRLTANDPTPVIEREFFARMDFGRAVDALRARVDNRLCPPAVAVLIETPAVTAALQTTFVAFVKKFGSPTAYAPEVAHGKRFLTARCGEFVPDVVDAAIQRRRGRWGAIMKGKSEE